MDRDVEIIMIDGELHELTFIDSWEARQELLWTLCRMDTFHSLMQERSWNSIWDAQKEFPDLPLTTWFDAGAISFLLENGVIPKHFGLDIPKMRKHLESELKSNDALLAQCIALNL